MPLLLAIVPWAVRWYTTRKISHRTPFDWPLLAFLITAGISVWAAFDKDSAWNKFWLIIGAILLYYAFANWIAEKGSQALYRQAWLLASLGFFIAIYFLFSHDWDAYPSKLDLLTRAGRSIGNVLPDLPLERFHPNVMAGAMAILLPFTAGVTIITWTRNQRRVFFAGFAMAVVTLIGFVLSGSRGAWLAVLLAAMVTICWAAIRVIVPGRRRGRSWFIGILIVMLLAVAAAVIFAPDFVSDRLAGLLSPESGLKRADLYRNSLILVNDYPFIGTGLDNFLMLYSTYALMLHVGFSTHAHNLFLDLSIQQGIIAVLIFVWMLVLMGEAVWRTIEGRRRRKRRNKPDGEKEKALPGRQGILLGAAASSVLIMLVHGLVDDPVYGTRMVVLMFVPFAFATPVLVKVRTPNTRQQIRAVFVGLLLIGIILVFSWRPVLSMIRSNIAAVQQGKEELGVYEWPEYPVQDAVRSEVNLSPVISGYERAISYNSGNASARRRLGHIQLSLGEYGEAIRHLEAAYDQAPWDNATRQLLGEAYLMNDRVDEGINLWSQTDNQQGQLDLRAGWYNYIGQTEKYDIVKEAIDRIE